MSIKEKLKQNRFLRMMVKRIKNHFEFFADAKEFSDHYIEVDEQNGKYKYRLLLLIHNIEKGMCYQKPRPFGSDKVKKIINILETASPEQCELFEYKLAKATLVAWRNFYIEKGWALNQFEDEFIKALGMTDLKAGYILLKAPTEEIRRGDFESVVFSRRSVRDFTSEKLKQEDIDFALKCFVAAPTACNRQMCKVYKIDDINKINILNSTLLGVGGFNTKDMTLFVITYDIGAFEFYGERNQGYVNVGLTAMNFVNGLHARGIGSCFMQWSNNRKEDKIVRTALGLPESERIGIVIGAGYYNDISIIPYSGRKPLTEIYKVL